MGSAQWQYVRHPGERMSDQDCVGNQKTRIDEVHTRIRGHGRESPVNWVCCAIYRARTLVRHTAGHTARCYSLEPAPQVAADAVVALPGGSLLEASPAERSSASGLSRERDRTTTTLTDGSWLIRCSR